MKAFISLLSILFLCIATTASAVDSTFLDYQNYNHGYCPDCSCYPCRCGNAPAEEETCNTCVKPDPCNPAPVCGCECGLTVCSIALAIAIVAATAAIIISHSGSSLVHAPNA